MQVCCEKNGHIRQYISSTFFLIVFNQICDSKSSFFRSGLGAIIGIENWWILQCFQESWALQRSTSVSKLGNLQICRKLCSLVGKPWTLRHLTFWRRASTFDDFLLKIIWPPCESEDIGRRCGHRSSHTDSTIKELKAMLLEEKDCEDPIERQILKVKVLARGLLVDDDETLESAELLHAESEVTVIYCRNEVEAATKEAIHEEGLLQVNIPSSLTEIPAQAFKECKQVVTVAVPESVTVIGRWAFEGCTSLVRLTIPESVTAIANNAFDCCSSLTSITIPESVTVIGGGAFRNCKSLARITLPRSVTAIPNFAFKGCRSLTSITIPQSVVVIGDAAFVNCISLKSITIPASVTAIGVSAFAECISLENITIPESVTAIGEGAFQYCSSLTSITIPEAVTAIEDYAFRGCRSLESITVPESVTAIGDCAFENCSSLASITIPESVTSIGKGAFAGCISLASITIPESLRENGQYAFNDELQAIIQHVWLWLFVATVGTLLFKFESDSLGQCGFSDQFNIISNSRTKQKSEEAKNPEMRNRTPEISQLPNEIDFRRFFSGKYSAPQGSPS